MGPQNWNLDPTPKTPLDPPPPRNSLCTVFCWENQRLHKEFGRLSPLLAPRPRPLRNSLSRFSLGVFSAREKGFYPVAPHSESFRSSGVPLHDCQKISMWTLDAKFDATFGRKICVRNLSPKDRPKVKKVPCEIWCKFWCQNLARNVWNVLPALLQKLVGEFFGFFGGKLGGKFGGNFAGFLRTHKIKAPIFGGKFSGTFSWETLCLEKRFRANFVLQMCHSNEICFLDFRHHFPCVSKQCPADGVWRIGRGGSPDRVLKTRFTPSESSAGHGSPPQRAP